MLAISRLVLFALVAVAVSACGIESHGGLRQGVITHDGLFIAPDGTVSVVDDFDPIKTFDDLDPRCVLVVGETVAHRPLPRMKVHRLLLHSEYRESDGSLCRFENERRYKALFLRPPEGAYLYTSSTPGTGYLADYRNNLAPIVLPHYLSVDPVEVFAGSYCVDVRGVLSQRGVYNHLGRSTYAFTITHVYRTWLVPPYETPEPPSGISRRDDAEYERRQAEYLERARELAIAACQSGS